MITVPVTKELNVILNFILDFLTQCYFVSFQFSNTAGFKLATSPYHDRNGGNSRGSNPGFFIFCQEFLLNDPSQLKDILDVRKVMVPVKRL